MKTFVTLGFEKRPFDRLLKAVDEGIVRGIIPEAILVQKGNSPYTLRRCPSVPFLSYAEMRSALKSAEIIIAHAGVGTLLQCLRLNKIPILFPRSASLGEHVDDHQIEFARIMEEHKKALVAYDGEQLWRIVQDYQAHSEGLSGAGSSNDAARLCDYLKGCLGEIRGEDS
jgi:UDP-N-acetylglucosamine transferase subunit ALG13